MRRFLLIALLVALALPAAARANGDPASDVLPFQQVFLPYEAPISGSAANQLKKTVAAANAKGYKVRVAVIPFTGDLGTAVSLWRHPQLYAEFLGKEIAFVYPHRTLIAMPSGFGVYNGGKPVTKELQALKTIKPGTTPTELTESSRRRGARHGGSGRRDAAEALRQLGTHDRLDPRLRPCSRLLLIVLVPARFFRRRGRGGGRSPSAGEGAPEPD